MLATVWMTAGKSRFDASRRLYSWIETGGRLIRPSVGRPGKAHRRTSRPDAEDW